MWSRLQPRLGVRVLGGAALAVVAPLVTVVVPVAAAPLPVVVNDTAPTVTGTPVFRGTLTATPGAWTPADVSTTYAWLREGTLISGATAATYHPGLADIGHRISVRVTASKEGYQPGTATSAPTTPVGKARFTRGERPTVDGVTRFGRTLTADPGSWSPRPDRVRFQWFRNDHAISGARHKRYAIGVADVGKRLAVAVTVRRGGFLADTARSRARQIRHRVPLRHVATYTVTTRGHVTADVAAFARLAQQSYDDPRGWRGAGIGFRRVRTGGDFTLVLAQAATVPRFSSACSATYSCRVGRFVIINQTRWLHATPLWHRVHRSLRDYRHMVVNHETGHWLGRGHATCPGGGRLAPVMMQQSKGLHGCRANPWPLRRERHTRFS